MFDVILSIIAILMAVLALAVVVSQSQKGLNLWSLCVCLLLLALQEGFDLLCLHQPDAHTFYKTGAMLSEALRG